MLSTVKGRIWYTNLLGKKDVASNSITDGTEFDSHRLFASNIFVATNNLVTQHFSSE